jgi:hypothetical protein
MEQVKIQNFKLVETKAGKSFYMLELSQGLELAVSKAGNPYLTSKKCWISSTLDEEGCQAAIGMTLPGVIEREACEEYSYVNAAGDLVTLNHKYVYHYDVVADMTPKSKKSEEELEFA